MRKISYFLAIFVVVGLFSACNQKKASQPAVEEKTETATDPKLVVEGPYEKFIEATDISPAYVLIEKPQVNLDGFAKDKDGFITLFDGTFNGWRGYDQDTVPCRWSVDDGAIKFSGNGGGEAQDMGGGDLIFAHKFKNFELTFDWKISEGGNSGVFFLAREIKGEPIYISAPEYQILDNANHPDATEGENGNRQSASLYDMKPANPQNAKPFGEWNTGSIKVYQGSVFHKQNGKTVVEYHLWTPQWNEMIKNSKFKQGGDFPLAYSLLINLGGDDREGYIGFQDHGNDVWFRNIKIKVLE